MKKLEWYNLRACKEIRVQTLIAAGFNLKTDYFRLDGRKLTILCECMKAPMATDTTLLLVAHVRSLIGIALQRVFDRMSK